MRILGNQLNCSTNLMKQILELLSDKLGQGHFDFLDHTSKYPDSEVFTFKSGAKLGRSGISTWYVHSAEFECDFHSALCELKAANFMRQARDLMHASQSLRRVPVKDQVTYGGFLIL